MPRPSLRGFLTLCAASLLQVLAPPAIAETETDSGPPAYLSIIIDDIGHSSVSGKRAINLPASLTYAVLPYAAHATSLATLAHQSGKEVMLHMPMENLSQFPLGTIALTSHQTEDDFVQMFDHAMSQVPHASGINNHMGSVLTQRVDAMTLLMSLVKQRDLYFVDSKTTPKSVASDAARQAKVRSASRDVFLDNVKTLAGIDRQFRHLIRKAKRNRTAIGIGHPYRVTLDYLEHALPMLEAENVRIIPVSEMLKLRTAGQQVASTSEPPVQADQPGV